MVLPLRHYNPHILHAHALGRSQAAVGRTWAADGHMEQPYGMEHCHQHNDHLVFALINCLACPLIPYSSPQKVILHLRSLQDEEYTIRALTNDGLSLSTAVQNAIRIKSSRSLQILFLSIWVHLRHPLPIRHPQCVISPAGLVSYGSWSRYNIGYRNHRMQSCMSSCLHHVSYSSG